MAHGMNARTMPGRGAMAKKGEKVLEHLRVMKSENGGHTVSHHFKGFEHEPEQAFSGGAPEGKVELPKGHVLQRIVNTDRAIQPFAFFCWFLDFAPLPNFPFGTVALRCNRPVF